MFMLDIIVDREYQLAYVTLGAGEFKRTICINNSLNIDVDLDDRVIGVEFFNGLSYSASELLQDYPHLAKNVLESVISARNADCPNLNARY